MKTAKEYIENFKKNKKDQGMLLTTEVEEIMIGFAKEHVNAAKVAATKVIHELNRKDVLEAYPLNLIL